MDRRRIAYDPHSYGAIGKELDFQGHVCVSFHPHKGMMKNESGPTALIEIPSRIVALEGAFYSPENTAKSEYDFDEVSQRTALEDLDSLFEGPDVWRLVDWQAEVWIPDGIPVAEFERVLFRNREDLDEALEASRGIELDRDSNLTFAVGKPWMFPTPAVAAEVIVDAEEIELTEWLP
jgi:hypothetical protein